MHNLKISNQYFENLVYNDSFSEFTIRETVFGSLPTFTLSFQDENKEKMRTLNELTPITTLFVIDEVEYSAEWVIKSIDVSESTDFFVANISGCLNKFGYYKNNQVPYCSGTSQEALKLVAENYFTFVDDAPEPQDKMNWLSFGKTDRRFINDIWRNSYIPDDFTLIAVNSNNEFIRTSLLTKLEQGAKTFFSNTDYNNGTTYLDAYPTASSLALTSFFGYPSVRDIFHEVSGSLEKIEINPEVIMTPSNTLNQSPDINRVVLTPLFQSANTHVNYQKARIHNFSILSSILTNSIMVYTDVVCPLGLFDLFNIETNNQASERRTFDGLYITTSITREFLPTGAIKVYYEGTREVSEEIK